MRRHASVRPLLRQVGGKPHASSDDHEQEPAKSRRASAKSTSQRKEAEKTASLPHPDSMARKKEPETIDLSGGGDINPDAEPLSSDAEPERKPIPETTSRTVPRTSQIGSGPAVTEKVLLSDDELASEEEADTKPKAKSRPKSKTNIRLTRGASKHAGKDSPPPRAFKSVKVPDDPIASDSSPKRGFKQPPPIPTEQPSPDKPARTFKMRGSQDSSDSRKRERSSDDDTDGWVVPDSKRSKPAYGKNIHASGQTQRRKKPTTYGSKGARESRIAAEVKEAKPKAFKTPAIPSSPKCEKRTAVFKTPGQVFGPTSSFSSEETLDSLGSTRAGDDERPQSSPLSSLPTTPEIETIDLSCSQSFIIDCAFCGKKVDRFLKEDFEDKYNKGKELTYKWQRRFCHYHKKHDIHREWQLKGYPEIDWSGLDRRMRKHDTTLIAYLKNETHSDYRETLKEKLKPGRKGMQQAYDAEEGERPGASVGYYGPRGEKRMVDYIIYNLSSEIRQHASNDKLVAASGVSGGVSGFVQTVLVPHLAELLVQEDMDLKGDWQSKARDIIAGSAELGELMHPEAEDSIVQSGNDNDE